MIDPTPHSGGARAARVRRHAVVAVHAVLAFTLGGCGIGSALVPWGGRAARPVAADPRHAAAARAAAAPERSPLEQARAQAALAPAEPYASFLLAQAQLAADSSTAAERSLREALRRAPGYPPALALLSKLWFERGRHAEAIRTIEEARAGGAALPPAVLAGLALHYDAAGRPELARRTLSALPREGRDGRATDPVEVYLGLRGDDPGAAGALAAAAADEWPRSAVARNNHGIALLRAGDPDRARRELERAIELDPGLAGPYYNLAILAKYYAFDDAAAARWFERYRERAHDDPDGLATALGGPPPSRDDRREGGTMSLRTDLASALLALALIHPYDAAAAPPAASPAPPAGPAARPAARPSAPAAAPAPAVIPGPRPAGTPAGRTLDAIHIEGEIAVPQVLFITARDQRRFLDSQHRRYLRTSLQLGAGTPLPARIAFTPPPGPDGRKENDR